jgi:predicted DNA-binding transcriptional regulator AlpA
MTVRLMRIEEVSEETGIPVETLRYWRQRQKGEGPTSARIGRRVVYRAADVDAWINAQFGDLRAV